MGERQFSPGGIVECCGGGFQQVLAVGSQIELLAAHQDLDGEGQGFEQGAIAGDDEVLLLLGPEGVVGGGDLQDSPVLALRWTGGRDQAEHVVCNLSHPYKLRLDAPFPGFVWHGVCVWLLAHALLLTFPYYALLLIASVRIGARSRAPCCCCSPTRSVPQRYTWGRCQ